MTENVDTYIPKERWKFNEEVAQVFPSMIKRSIPGYADMRSLCVTLGLAKLAEHRAKNTNKPFKVLDVGASHGGGTWHYHDQADVDLTLVDEQEAMTAASRAQFTNFPSNQPVLCKHNHVTAKIEDYLQLYQQAHQPFYRTDALYAQGPDFHLVYAILTTMFLPNELRAAVYAGLKRKLERNGTLILVEKTMQPKVELERLFNHVYWEHKRAEGYSEELIEKKRESLKFSLCPITPQSLEDMLRAAGFRVTRFWQNLHFVGVVCHA